ncbi:DJ-1/PfpI family protein [Bradyrhizobium sp. STM 3557]|uniref:DJ-1/PfpI family protein n=1 Tax=Bradyrhizobium sp. STM 3557 TaxID=578920 RepID=UPI003890D343
MVLLRYVMWGGLAFATLSLAGFGLWLSSLPLPTAPQATPVPKAEEDAMLAALRPPKGDRPLIVVVGINDATETNDYLMPTGILRRADVANVMMLSTGPGPVQLYPVLRVEPDASIAAFDASHPEGADYVIVPAMSRDDDPAVLAWLRTQSQKGAKIIGVCAGAKVVAAAGLLDGRRATTHWYYVGEMLKRNPTIKYVADRRMVSDDGVTTTTGITASMPMMLTLIEAIAGRDKADAVARDLGLDHWDARHASAAFKFTRPFAMTALLNTLTFWNWERFGIWLKPGVDEVSLALIADAWSRTYRSSAETFAATAEAVETRNGVRVLPDRVATGRPEERRLLAITDRHPVGTLDEALHSIGLRYGMPTAYMVAMQLEYPDLGQTAIGPR